MSNNIKLENPLYGVSLTLAERVVINTTATGGGGGGANFVYTGNFIAGSSGNTINHNLNKYCSVTVVDSNDDVVIGEIHYNSVNQVTLTFTAAFTGKAYCN
jgi:hypothetical protein